MTPFFWYSVAIAGLSAMAGMGLMALIMRPWAPRICALAHAPVPPPPATSQPRPGLEEPVSWNRPPMPGPRHVKPRLTPTDPRDYQLPPAPGDRARSAGGGR